MSDTERRPNWLPLRTLANALTLLLGLAVAALAARLIIDLSWPAGSGTSWRRTELIDGVDKVADVTMFVLAIVFVAWFHRARVNAEFHDYRQRRARAWTFWGWIVPVVSLWFPFQLMGDIWRAGLPASKRDKVAWLPALWWTSWLLSGVFFAGQTGGAPSQSYIPIPRINATTAVVSMCFLINASAMLIPIIRTVSFGPVGRPPELHPPEPREPATSLAEGYEA